VAVYLDEQSTQIPGRNLDVYAADLERIEVLEGPQGTLFGAGAQAGVLRYITNKPKLDVTEGNFNASFGSTEHGDESGGAEGVINLPLIEGKAALRVVAFTESRGGYIDNVGSTFTRRGTDLGFAYRTGGVVPTDSVVINNYNIEKDDINGVDYRGFRASLAYKINDDWDVLIAQSWQDVDAGGVFYQHPVGSDLQDLNPLEVTLFNDSNTKDKFNNTALTVNGTVGVMDVVYAGTYLKRDSTQIQDYTNYARGVYGTYYQCTGYSGASVDKCYSPSSVWTDETENKNQSHELRFSTPGDWRLRGIAGLFWEKRELNDDTAWLYKSVPECAVGSSAACFFPLDPANTPKFENASFNNPGQRNSNTGFVDDFQRTYEQKAVFASVDFDIIPDVLTATVGSRYYDMSNEMLGGNFGSFYCKNYGATSATFTGTPHICGDAAFGGTVNGNAPYGTNLDNQDPNNDSVTDHTDRFNISWNVTDEIMVYATYSEGFRMGGFNRGRGSGALRDANGVKQWYVPLAYDSGELTNYEAGWKTTLLDNRLQFNGAVFFEEWKDFQVGFQGANGITQNVNGPTAEILGTEMDVLWAATENLMIISSWAYYDSEIQDDYCPGCQSPKDINGDGVIGGPGESANWADEGEQLPLTAKFKGNLTARYTVPVGDFEGHLQATLAYQGKRNSSLNIRDQELYYPEFKENLFVDLTAGLAKESYEVELFVKNVTNEDTPLAITSQCAPATCGQQIYGIPARPRTIGLKFTQNF
jgi:outer membrane receptor protein involved in Fe transport